MRTPHAWWIFAVAVGLASLSLALAICSSIYNKDIKAFLIHLSCSATITYSITMSAAASKPVLLPQKGTARVKNVMSGDTVILWGKPAAPHLPPPQVQFTLDGLMSPR